MQPSGFEYWSIGDASLELSVPPSNLRYFIDSGKVPSRRASDGSRLMTHDDIKTARDWLRKHEAEKKKKREALKKKRQQLRALTKKKTARSRRK